MLVGFPPLLIRGSGGIPPLQLVGIPPLLLLRGSGGWGVTPGRREGLVTPGWRVSEDVGGESAATATSLLAPLSLEAGPRLGAGDDY